MPNINLIRKKAEDPEPVVGDAKFDQSNGKMYVWDGNSWVEVELENIDLDLFDHEQAYDRAMSIL